MSHTVKLGEPGAVAEVMHIIRHDLSARRVEIAMETYRQLALATPVDTGRGRWGWYMTVGSPSSSVPPEGFYGFPDLSGHIEGDLSVDGTIYITNNVSYLVYVNNGTRHIAPRLFVEAAVMSIRTALSAMK